MKNIYESPALEIVRFTPGQFIAYLNFSDIKDAAELGNGGALEVDPASEVSSDVHMPRD